MLAKKCDRCGEYFEDITDNTRWISVNTSNGFARMIYIGSKLMDIDLCPMCKTSFQKWWENDSYKDPLDKDAKEASIPDTY